MPTVSVPFQDLAKRIEQQEAELAKLRQELESRHSQLSELNRRKEDLQAELAKVEQDIQAVGQAGVVESTVSVQAKASSAKSAAKPGEGLSLPKYLITLVRAAKGPVTAKELADTVVRNNYPSTSKNLADIVKTRVHDLVKKGVLLRDGDSSGLVLAESVQPSKSATAASSPKKGKQATTAKPAVTIPMQPTQWRSLHEVMLHVLANSAKPLKAQDIAEAVLESGYESSSKNFKNVIWSSLGKLPNVESIPEGYRLKKGKGSGAKK
jgi:hypothetical protein